MKNKKGLVKGIVALIAIGYFALAILFVYNILSLNELYQKEAEAYIADAENALHDTLRDDASVEKLDELIEKYPMELVIHQEEGSFYRTIPVRNLNVWFGTLNRDAVALEAHFEGVVNDVYSEVWFCLYQISEERFLTTFLIRQSLLLIALFFIAILSIFYGQKLLYRPLKEVRKSIEKAKHYEFYDPSKSTDEVNREFGEFTQKVDKTVRAISYENTKLETELQQERERMKNSMTVARSLVHNLKAPVHQNLMENESVMMKNEDKMIQELTHRNVKMADRVLKSINETLDLLKEDSHENIKNKEMVDVEELYMETIQLYHPQIKEKRLSLDITIDNQSTLFCNRACLQLLAHNLISNMIQYAAEKTVLKIAVEYDEKQLILRHQNKGSIKDIERMKKTEKLFNVVQLEKNETNRYSSGNGLFLIQDLIEMLNGQYILNAQGEEVMVQAILPVGGDV